ncbi:MAG: hypothetical protein IID05_07515 [Gemmatimonadetes bacterium]|nr:hypothetical protein [Gemmatimonadota bacterium]
MTPIECKSRLSLRLMGAGRFAPQLFLACTATHTLTHGAAAADAQTTSAAAIERAIAVPSTDMLAAHVQFLADDLMAGRAPGSRGASVAARYIRSQFQAAGLEPGAPNGSFFQSVRLIGVTPQPAIVVGIAQRTMALRYLDDFVAWPDGPARGVVSDGEIVFVGYGIDAPEWQWNDYSGESVNGKIVMMLVNDPGLNDSTIFRGREMTRYGHWSYKIDEAARRGAAGVILIHTIRLGRYRCGSGIGQLDPGVEGHFLSLITKRRLKNHKQRNDNQHQYHDQGTHHDNHRSSPNRPAKLTGVGS